MLVREERKNGVQLLFLSSKALLKRLYTIVGRGFERVEPLALLLRNSLHVLVKMTYLVRNLGFQCRHLQLCEAFDLVDGARPILCIILILLLHSHNEHVQILFLERHVLLIDREVPHVITQKP